jgi:nucleoside-diphosphate-sugar epimerase
VTLATPRRILVAGGSGKLGQAVIAELLAHGLSVCNLDLVAPRTPGARFMRTDFRDFGQCVDALSFRDVGWDSADALVHLAAIPGPYQAPDSHLFVNNLQSTFNLWRAAQVAGIRNVVWASSETLLGVPFDQAPQQLPLDETVSRPESTYALVKHLEEEMARQLCRQDPQRKLLGLRLSYVHDNAELQRLRDQIAERAANPRHQCWNLWSYISARDAARAVRLAVDLEMSGTDQVLIANADTVMPQTTRELMAAVYPGVPLPASLAGHQSLIDCGKARRLLGWVPGPGWRAAVDGGQIVEHP